MITRLSMLRHPPVMIHYILRRHLNSLGFFFFFFAVLLDNERMCANFGKCYAIEQTSIVSFCGSFICVIRLPAAS
jgi:hypothetical protein